LGLWWREGFVDDKLLYERMLSEISIYAYRHRDRFFDWQAVVIYPSRTIEQPRRELVREFLASGRIVPIYLDELGARAELPIGLGLMVPTTLEGDAAKIEAKRLIALAQGSKAIIEIVSTIIVYKFTNLTRDEVNAMLEITLPKGGRKAPRFSGGDERCCGFSRLETIIGL
jgi:predicted transposase YdaD